MTSFRTQLRQAADQHREQTYPGDLADGVLKDRFRLRAAVGVGLIAAGLAIACLIVFTGGSDKPAAGRMVRRTIDRPTMPARRIDLPTLSGKMPSVRLPRMRGAHLPTRLNLSSLRPVSLRSHMKSRPNRENSS